MKSKQLSTIYIEPETATIENMYSKQDEVVDFQIHYQEDMGLYEAARLIQAKWFTYFIIKPTSTDPRIEKDFLFPSELVIIS